MFLNQALYSKNPFWMYLLGSFVVIIFTVIGQFPIMFFMTGESLATASGDPMVALRNLDKNLQLLLLLIPFVVGFLGLILVVKKLHERTLKSISTARERIDWKRVLFAFVLWGGVTVVLVFADYFLHPEDYQWNFEPTSFALLFLIAVALIPIQTSLEEYIFRGYLMQGFASYSKSRWVALLMTSLIFGTLHVFNPEVEKLGYGILFYYIGTGLFLGILTLMDQGIELALGFHAANNLVTALLVTSSWTAFQTESLLIDISTPSLGAELIISLFIFYPLFLWIMSKKYHWTAWKEKLISRL
ncbi:MAG: CPBP family intramembrane metalloprotease [Flavobacteriaceae bacterium]|nr:CPBP family intramembrane metalloprotease [Flavobacteriaceae bacterium]MDG1921039.1 CPBP family intramembrane metalloprotease [Flavobacteriaceae bacterium]